MKTYGLLLAIALVIVLPFIFQKEQSTVSATDESIVVITPHDEGIRHEFEIGFTEYYLEKTGKSVDIDWRVIGGTSEIVRFIQATYTNNFRNYWETELGKTWNAEVQNSFMNRRVSPAVDPSQDSPEQAAKRAFLESSVSCGIDVFFGGGSYDFTQQSRAGTLVPFATQERIASLFPDEIMPVEFAGEPFYDPEGKWVGAVLSQFGIIYNVESLENLGIDTIPDSWEALTDPRLFRQLALADPMLSGSATKAFEMIIQQQMLKNVNALGDNVNEETIQNAVEQGWQRGMEIIQLISANSRYFTDSSKKPSIDVSTGECAAGMSIDFYGRFQAETVYNRSGKARMGYLTPLGGSTVSVDPIGLLRGAPNEEVSKAFIEYVMSEAGQKLWNFKVGTPGGTQSYALRRSPAIRTLYTPEYKAFRSDPDVNPYDEAGDFVYHPEWTARLFSPLRFIIKSAFIDTHQELTEAWQAIIQARDEGRNQDAEAAFRTLTELSRVDYSEASGNISDILNERTKISELRLSRELTIHFQQQYKKALRLAQGS